MLKRIIIRLLSVLTILSLAACGGSGGNSSGSGNTPVPTTTVTGIASKGPINGGTVKVYAVRNGTEDRSAPIGQGVTDSSGLYSVNLGTYTGPIVVEVTGGSYIDEVSGSTVNLTVPLRAVVTNVLIGSNTAAVTALTELAYRRALGSVPLTPSAIGAANTAVGSLFTLADITGTVPGTGTATEAQKKYAFALGAFSQLVNDSKTGTEPLASTLSRVLSDMGSEQQAGGISLATITSINNAITAYSSGGKNQTGSSVAPVPAPTAGILKLSTTGTAATIGAIDVTVTLPAGVRIAADALTGETATGVIATSGVAASGSTLSTGRFTPASGGVPAKVRVNVINATGFGLGEYVTIAFTLENGAAFPAGTGAVSVSGFSAVGLNGLPLTGLTSVPSSLGATIP